MDFLLRVLLLQFANHLVLHTDLVVNLIEVLRGLPIVLLSYISELLWLLLRGGKDVLDGISNDEIFVTLESHDGFVIDLRHVLSLILSIPIHLLSPALVLELVAVAFDSGNPLTLLHVLVDLWLILVLELSEGLVTTIMRMRA